MIKQFICMVVLALSSSLASAGVIVQNLSIARNTTDFDVPVVFALFDNLSSGRLLESVVVELFARSSGNIAVENKSKTRSANITATLSTSIILLLQDGVTFLSAAPKATRTDNLGIFDGVTDYNGLSGVQFLNIATNDYEVMTFTLPSFLSLFTGNGQGHFTFEALATSNVIGGGNLATEINTFASADVRITYNYAEVPEKGTILLLLLGAMAVITRRKIHQ